jgi:hypothetical protein
LVSQFSIRGCGVIAAASPVCARKKLRHASPDDIANLQRGRIYDAPEIEALAVALKNSGRSIIRSLSPGASPVSAAPRVKQ